MCQSVASPRSAEYWHIGEITIRFGSVTPRSVNGENNAVMEAARVQRKERISVARTSRACRRAVGQ